MAGWPAKRQQRSHYTHHESHHSWRDSRRTQLVIKHDCPVPVRQTTSYSVQVYKRTVPLPGVFADLLCFTTFLNGSALHFLRVSFHLEQEGFGIPAFHSDLRTRGQALFQFCAARSVYRTPGLISRIPAAKIRTSPYVLQGESTSSQSPRSRLCFSFCAVGRERAGPQGPVF